MGALLLKMGVKPTAVDATGTPQFVLSENRFLTTRRKKEAKRRSMRAFIKPENAQAVADQLPEPGDAVHCLLNGNFVLADLIPRMIGARHVPHLRASTLGLSVDNASLIAEMARDGRVGRATIVCSHYFEQVNKESVFAEVKAKLQGIAQIVVTRSHAKIILVPIPPDWYAIEGSANLRSSDNLEQITIFNDQSVHDFHAGWIDELAARANHE